MTAEPSIDVDENVSRVADDTTINVDAQGPVKFSVWVSFAEIYNETIYDLLEPCPTGKGKKRTTHRLGDDTNGNPYIKGEFLLEVQSSTFFFNWDVVFLFMSTPVVQ